MGGGVNLSCDLWAPWPARLYFAAYSHFVNYEYAITNTQEFMQLGGHVRPAYQPTITGVALCGTKFGQPCYRLKWTVL